MVATPLAAEEAPAAMAVAAAQTTDAAWLLVRPDDAVTRANLYSRWALNCWITRQPCDSYCWTWWSAPVMEGCDLGYQMEICAGD